MSETLETSGGGIEVNLGLEEIREQVFLANAVMVEALSEKIADEAKGNLDRIGEESKYPYPGGYGWWDPWISQGHGFLRDSIQRGKYRTREREPGGFVRLSSLYFPVEYGTKRGKRGWFKRGGKGYKTRRNGRIKKRYEEIEIWDGPRGPSVAKPFLHPAVESHRDEAARILVDAFKIPEPGRKG